MARIALEPWATVEIGTNGGTGETVIDIKNSDSVEDAEVIIDVVGGDFARTTAWPAIKMLGGNPNDFHRRESIKLRPFEEKRVTLSYAGAIAQIRNQSTARVTVSH